MFIHFNQDPQELEKIAKKLNVDPSQLSVSTPIASLDLWKTLLNNKMVVSLVCFLFSLVMAWGIWATNAIHAQDKSGAVTKESVRNVKEDIGEAKEDIGEVKETTKEIQVEQKEMRKEQYDRDLKMMEKLNEIGRKVD